MTAKEFRALTIAGFDPSGGAGVLADARTFIAFGLRPVAAITSITSQDTARVFAVANQTAAAVGAQVAPLLAAGPIACVKLGMLPTRAVVLEVARILRAASLPRAVLDPVITSSSGFRLMDEDALPALLAELLPLVQLVTPNIPEAETLTGMKITSQADMHEAALALRKLGAAAVLIKGGHLIGQEADGGPQTASRRPTVRERSNDSVEAPDEAVDVLDNDGTVTVFRERRVSGADLHGSGCLLSAAIAAGLGKGMTLEDSVGVAKRFVLEAIRDCNAPHRL
jgi:hydroxymethylpyrimidine/phosphomethylpyrimidine kinase